MRLRLPLPVPSLPGCSRLGPSRPAPSPLGRSLLVAALAGTLAAAGPIAPSSATQDAPPANPGTSPATQRASRAAADAAATSADADADRLPDGAVVRLGTRRLRQDGMIRGVSFLDGSARVASMGFDQRVRLWDTATGRQVGALDLGPGTESWTTSSDGTLAVVGAGPESTLLPLPGGPPRPPPVAGEQFALSGDGAILAGWNRDGGTLSVGAVDGSGGVREFDGGGQRVTAAALSEDGARLVTAGVQLVSRRESVARVRLWDRATGELLAEWERPGSVLALELLPGAGSPRVAAGLASGGLLVLGAGAESPLAEVAAHPYSLTALDPAPGGWLVTGSAGGQVARWDLDDLLAGRTEPTWRTQRHAGPVHGVAVSPDGALVASGGNDQIVRLWTPDGEPVLDLERHESGLRALARSPDGTRIATGDWHGRVAVWPVAGGDPTWLRGHLDAVHTLSFLDARRLAATSRDGSLRVWDVDSGEELGARPLDAAVLDSAVSPDGALLATARGDGSVDLWDVAAPGGNDPEAALLTHRASFASGGQMAFAVDFTPDGRRLAVGSSAVRLFDLASGELLWETAVGSPVGDLAVAPDGSRLAVAVANRAVRLLDLEHGALGEDLHEPGRLVAVAWSPDGRALAAAASNATTFVVWDVASGEAVGRHPGHASAITALDWARGPDGPTLVSAGGDGTALVWRR